MAKMLTAKQEKFIQGLVKGMTQRQAYKSSYNCKRMQDRTIDNKASELFKKHEIRVRYQEYMQKTEKSTIATAQEVLEKLTSFMRDEIDGSDTKDVLKATELMGKRYKLFIEKVEVENDSKVVIVDD